MDQDNAGQGSHQIQAVEDHADRYVKPHFGKGVAQQEGKQENSLAFEIKSSQRISGGDADQHRNEGDDHRQHEGKHNGADQTVLLKYEFPPFKAELLRNHRRNLIFVRKGQHAQVHKGKIEKQNEHTEQNIFQEMFLPHSVVHRPRAHYFHHRHSSFLIAVNCFSRLVVMLSTCFLRNFL